MVGSDEMEEMENQYEKMLEMMKFIQMMQEFNESQHEEDQENEGHKSTMQNIESETHVYFDDYIYTPELRAIKAAIPYLDVRYQRMMAIFIKFIEIQKLMEMYSSNMINKNIQMVSNGDWRRGMLSAIKPHMPPDKQRKIDMLLQVASAFEMYNKMMEVQNGY